MLSFQYALSSSYRSQTATISTWLVEKPLCNNLSMCAIFTHAT